MILLLAIAWYSPLNFEITNKNIHQPLCGVVIKTVSPEFITAKPEKVIVKEIKPGETRIGRFYLSSSRPGKYRIKVIVTAGGKTFSGEEVVNFKSEENVLGELPLIEPRGEYMIKVFDVTGRLRFKGKGKEDGLITIPHGSLKPGIYFYRYQDKKTERSGKLVIVR